MNLPVAVKRLVDRRELLAPIRGIVFDKDGTLADLSARWFPLFVHIVNELCDDLDDRIALSVVLGVRDDHLVADGPAAVKSEAEVKSLAVAYLVDRGWQAERASRRYDAACFTAPFGPLTPIGDVAGTMRSLAAAGYQLGVATSDSRANTVAELDELGIANIISALRCGDDETIKPSPRVLLGIGEAWSLTPPQILFVGDSLQDAETARAAGCLFVALVGPGSSPVAANTVVVASDAWIQSIDELIET